MLDVHVKASSRYPIRRKRIKQVISRTLESTNHFGHFEIEVGVVGDRKMRLLKHKHLGVDETTDVLSFPLEFSGPAPQKTVDMTSLKQGTDLAQFPQFPDGITRLGSIYVSYPQAQRQANLHKLLIDDEIDQLVEHGMLHLLGFHHK